jgi:rhamnulokinase
MSIKRFIAFDLGAESGRTILGTLENGKIEIRELNRFQTGYVDLNGAFVWNLIGFYDSLKEGLKICADYGVKILDGIGVDTWGVDFVLLDSDGNLVGMPYSYRDKRTNGIMDSFFNEMPKKELYQRTGIQVMQINSLFQLYSIAKSGIPYFDLVHDLLFIPDYFTYLFTGNKVCEFSIASTSQMYNSINKKWDESILDAAGIPISILHKVIPSGTIAGYLSDNICTETGIIKAPVIATAGHDTGSAIAAVPAEGTDWAYISSGTWSLMGIESERPIITDETYKYNFSNEGGVGDTARILKNIMGLWLIQQCRKSRAKDCSYSYAELTQMAQKEEPFRSIIDPDYSAFLNPDDMPVEIANYCRKTNQPIPKTPGQFMRCIVESLALKYRMVMNQIKEINPSQPYNKIHIIGGGTQNEMLSQFTADAANMEVVAGPIESTAVGNILIQAMAVGCVKSRDEIREIVRNSFSLKSYKPQNVDVWNNVYSRFLKLVELGD